MAIERTIQIDGQEVKLKSSAALPRLYRIKFKRDILVDMKRLEKSYNKNQNEDKAFERLDLEIFENVAYIMAYAADRKNTPDNIYAWLDKFNSFSIYEVFPVIAEMWSDNEFCMSKQVKKRDRQLDQ